MFVADLVVPCGPVVVAVRVAPVFVRVTSTDLDAVCPPGPVAVACSVELLSGWTVLEPYFAVPPLTVVAAPVVLRPVSVGALYRERVAVRPSGRVVVESRESVRVSRAAVRRSVRVAVSPAALVRLVARSRSPPPPALRARSRASSEEVAKKVAHATATKAAARDRREKVVGISAVISSLPTYQT